MRNLETIDAELHALASVRWSIRNHGGEPGGRQIDDLLDERSERDGRDRSARRRGGKLVV
jgi:hypothetical protein